MVNLDNLLIDKKINNKIEKENEEQLKICELIVEGIIPNLLEKLNILETSDKETNTINQAIYVLYAQIVMTYKSTLLLAINGYYTNALNNLRNILDAYFTIRHISNGNYKEQFKRANKYLTIVDGKWTTSKVIDRALNNDEEDLYKYYEILCSYSHANFMGTGQQFDGRLINIYPQVDKIKETLIFTNAIFIYCIEFLINKFNLKIDLLRNVNENEDLYEMKRAMSHKKDVKYLFNLIYGDNLDKIELESLIKEYFEYEEINKNVR